MTKIYILFHQGFPLIASLNRTKLLNYRLSEYKMTVREALEDADYDIVDIVMI